MFASLFTKAQDIASSGAEVITDAAVKAKEVAKGKANEFTLAQLKTSLEGSRQQELEAPDVWVEILEVDLSQGLEACDINIFSLKGLHVKIKVDVIGTVPQLAGMMAASSAEKAMGKVDVGESLVARKLGFRSLGLGAFAAKSAANAKAAIAGKAAAGSETKSADFDLKVDLEKTLGVAEVVAKVEVLDSSSDVLKKYLSDTTIQRYAEDALGKRVTSELTNLHKEFVTVAKASDALQGKATELGAKVSEHFAAGLQQSRLGGR